MLDLIVIGAGLSGLMAAYTAARAGLKVKVIAKGLGALHWSAGTVDVLGYYPDEQTLVQQPLQMIRELVKAKPDHPYALLDETELTGALQSFAALARGIDLPYARQPEGAALSVDKKNLMLPSPVGAARPAFLAPQAQWAGDLARAEPMLIVGLRGMRDFFPHLIAENLGKQQHSARAAFQPLDLITDRRDSNTVQLANGLDDPARRVRLAAELKKLVAPGERIGLPAILGMAQHAAVMQELQATIGAPVLEIPTLPPSVPGVRLNAALRSELERQGVRVEVNMDIEGLHTDNGRITSVETRTSARPLQHRADKFLLATGGILGGGITTDHTGHVREVVFDLPLAAPAERNNWFRRRFLDPAGHPIFAGGVPVNRQFQPVHPDGTPAYANLWAAGGCLAHADQIRERSMEGIAIATGVAAATRLAA
jgi:glycerol-3-phosphate dehydrogenase subunit B